VSEIAQENHGSLCFPEITQLFKREWGQFNEDASKLIGSKEFGELESHILPGIERFGKTD
jgi:hypothetical protein